MDIVSKFFEEKLSDIKCSDDTKAYIISIYSNYKQSTEDDLSQGNITLRFCQARTNHKFLEYQRLGNYILYAETLYPESLRFASKDYYDEIAKLSYLSCYNLINRQWQLYYELYSKFNYLEHEIKSRLKTP